MYDLIEKTLEIDMPNLEKLIEQAKIEFIEDGLISRESLIRFLDLRWSFNGALAL